MFATGAISVCAAAANACMLQHQKSRLDKLKDRASVNLAETTKLLREKDEMVAHLYKLYTIVTELDQIMESVLSPVYTPNAAIAGTLRHARFEHGREICQMAYSLHSDVNAYVYTVSQLFRWIEIKNNNRTAIHAMHALHVRIETVSRMLHLTQQHRIRVPLIVQKAIGDRMRGGGGLNTYGL